LRRSLASAFAVCLLVPGTASARFDTPGTPPPPPPLPGPGATFVVSGHGWGHGVGLSQYGALGFAQHGSTYAKILAYYYRGTTLGAAPARRVRVLLGQGKKKLTVGSQQPFSVVDGAGKTHGLAAGNYSFGPGLSIRIDVADKPQPLPGPLTFVPGTAPLELDRPYRGQIQVAVDAGKLRAIDVVPLEQYLYGVVPAEMPASWPAEALKAQAVAARSYALSHLQTGDFDLFADTRSQVYRGVAGEKPTTTAAVDATAGQVALYGGKVASTFFFSTSGGRTMSAEDAWGEAVPYLLSVSDPYDSISPYHDWGPVAVPAKKFQQALKLPGRLLDVATTRNPSGRAADVVGTGTEGDLTVPAADVRRALGLRSTWFDVGALAIVPPQTGAPPLTYGSRAALSGIARGVADVVLEQKEATAAEWSPVGALAPSKDGSFAVGVKPLVTTRYRVSSGDVAAQPVRLAVAPLVRFLAAPKQTSLRGLERPLLPGTTVQVQRLADTAWKTVATATVDAGGNFEAKLKLVPGDYRARFAPGRGFVPGLSKVLRVLG
jgi:stage II sporulation protein D